MHIVQKAKLHVNFVKGQFSKETCLIFKFVFSWTNLLLIDKSHPLYQKNTAIYV